VKSKNQAASNEVEVGLGAVKSGRESFESLMDESVGDANHQAVSNEAEESVGLGYDGRTVITDFADFSSPQESDEAIPEGGVVFSPLSYSTTIYNDNPSSVYKAAVTMFAAIGMIAITFYVCKAIYNSVFESSFKFIPIQEEV